MFLLFDAEPCTLVKILKVENFCFQVKDKNEYKFEPAKIVRKICAIYVHLGSSDTFCAAVSRDGRSYSSQLFEQAASVLGSFLRRLFFLIIPFS